MKKFLGFLVAALLPIAAVTAMEASPASAAGAFTCSSTLYQTSTTPKGISSFGTDPTNTATYQKFTQLGGNFATAVNAAGYNPLDNYIWGLAGTKLAKIDNAGTMTNPYSAAPTGTGSLGSSGGDFLPYDGSGHAYLLTASGNTWSRIDVTTNTFISYTNSGSTAWASLDMTIVGDGTKAYDVNGGVLQVATINNTAHTFSVVNRTITYPNTIGSGDSFGAAFHDAAGDLFFFDNTSKYMYYMPAAQLLATTPALTQFGAVSTLVSPNDGAACGTASSPLAPTVNTGSATSITDTAATLAGTVLPINGDVNAPQQICYSLSPTVTNGLLSSSPTCVTAGASVITSSNSVVTNLTANLTGLSNGTKYYYQAVATGANGMVGFGAVRNFTTTGGNSVTAPIVNTDPTATSVTSTSATLAGWVTTDARAGSEIDGSGNIVILYSTSSAVDANGQLVSGVTSVVASPGTMVSGDYQRITANATALTAGTTYYYQAKATNHAGLWDVGSVESFTTTGGVVTVAPVVTTNASATGITATGATVGGTVTTGSNAPEAVDDGNVNICYSTSSHVDSSGQLDTDVTCLDATPAGAPSGSNALPVSLVITGLTGSTTYYYQANAGNQRGQVGAGAVHSFITLAAPAQSAPVVVHLPYYLVSFVSQGMTWASTQAEVGTTFACPSAPPRDGYIFKGWEGCAPGELYTITGPATLNAIWVELLSAQPNAVGGQNAHKDEPVTLVVNTALTGQVYTDPAVGIKLTLTPNEADKTQAPLNADHQVVFKEGRLAKVSGSGLHPNSDVQVYISKSALTGLSALPVATAALGGEKAVVITDPILLGTLHTDANGNFMDWLPIPADLAPGAHALQVDGYAPDWSLHSANFPVVYTTQVQVKHNFSKSLTVYFTPDSAAFTGATTKAIADLIGLLPKDGESFSVSSQGFVYPIDSHTANMRISSARAQAVALALKNGIKALGQQATVDHVGLGRLKAADKTSRRVEATVSWTVTETVTQG